MIDDEDRKAIGFSLAHSLVTNALLPDLMVACARERPDPQAFIRELRLHVSARIDALAQTQGNAGVIQLLRPAVTNLFDTAEQLLGGTH